MSQRILQGSDVCDGLEAAYYGRVTSVTSVTTRARLHTCAHMNVFIYIHVTLVTLVTVLFCKEFFTSPMSQPSLCRQGGAE